MKKSTDDFLFDVDCAVVAMELYKRMGPDSGIDTEAALQHLIDSWYEFRLNPKTPLILQRAPVFNIIGGQPTKEVTH